MGIVYIHPSNIGAGLGMPPQILDALRVNLAQEGDLPGCIDNLKHYLFAQPLLYIYEEVQYSYIVYQYAAQ